MTTSSSNDWTTRVTSFLTIRRLGCFGFSSLFNLGRPKRTFRTSKPSALQVRQTIFNHFVIIRSTYELVSLTDWSLFKGEWKAIHVSLCWFNCEVLRCKLWISNFEIGKNAVLNSNSEKPFDQWKCPRLDSIQSSLREALRPSNEVGANCSLKKFENFKKLEKRN